MADEITISKTLNTLIFNAKAQRRQGAKGFLLGVFAPLRLCVKS
jgi:hypothetical protein